MSSTDAAPRHRVRSLRTSINITVASKNHDFQDRVFGPTVPALSLEQSCGMTIRDMYLSLEPLGAQLDAKVRSYSQLGSSVSMDRTQSHTDPNEKSLPAPSLDVVLNGYLKTSKVNRSKEKRVWEQSPHVDLLRWCRFHRNKTSHTLLILVRSRFNFVE